MSDQQIGKREEELMYLNPFTEAYQFATGEDLSLKRVQTRQILLVLGKRERKLRSN